MNFTGEEHNEKPMIVIDEKPEFIPGQPEGETPIIIIEDDGKTTKSSEPMVHRRRWPWVLGSAVVTALICAFVFSGSWYYLRYFRLGVPVSVTSEQNIAKLQKPTEAVRPEVVLSSDSILGVALNFYELRGLKGEISFEEPSENDKDVYFYSMCSDFTSYDPATNQYIGSLVMNGKEMQSDVSRLGYCAMANGNVVIGIARNEKVKDYCIAQGGSFFRQFILVSNGVLPPRFFLHGKVERRALGRIGDTLYYIETRHAETMWDFADALREYGFIDAIYITGGTMQSYYRDAEGKPHSIGTVKAKEGRVKVPWMVFRKR